MNILLTFDYELFFGTVTGTQNKCMVYPTNELIQIANKNNIRLSFFVDCGYLFKLKEFKHLSSNLHDDYQIICSQLKDLVSKGHDVQLHIHPHWEDTHYDGKKWVMNTSRYRLHAFTEESISDIVKRYSETLFEITGQPLHTFRAGGWCLQPFEKLKKHLQQTGIKVDSSFFKEGHEESEHYYYDFRNCPDKEWWKFEDDPLKEDEHGTFTELPISAMTVSPLFYWKLYLLGRLNPAYHKPIGDGKPILSSGYKSRILSHYTRQVISLDGYNARLIKKQTEEHHKKNVKYLVILGHPKALSPYSLKTLDTYIATHKNENSFITYSDFIRINNL